MSIRSSSVLRIFGSRFASSVNAREQAEETRSTANKVRQFLSNPYLASIIGFKYSTHDVAHCMNEGKI